MILHIIILVATFVGLAFLVDRIFVPSLEVMGKKLKMNSEIAGATLMAVGSSAPEFFTSVFALLKVGDDIASLGAGTIVGSAIFNILAIIGCAVIFASSARKLVWQPVVRDLSFYGISIVLIYLFFRDAQIVMSEALILVAVYILYLICVWFWRKWFNYEIVDEEDHEELRAIETFSQKQYILTFIVSIILIALLSHYMVESAVHIAHILGVPSAIVGLTILAIGTSIPDLFSSIIVAKDGKADMAVSNAIGSNVFDILIGIGLVYVLYLGGALQAIKDFFLNLFGRDTTPVAQVDAIPVDVANLTGSVVLLFATIVTIIGLLVIQKWKMNKASGLFLILVYIAYLVYAIMKAV